MPLIGIEEPLFAVWAVAVYFFIYLGDFAVVFPVHVFLTIALFIIVPLIFTRLDWIGFERHRFLWPLRFTPLAAFPAFIALILHGGEWPAEIRTSFAIPWLIFTAYAGIVGLLSLRMARTPHRVAAALSLIMLAGGGVWFMIACAGWPVLPFTPQMVLLTATHFHYAGFATLALVAMQERFVASQALARVAMPKKELDACLRGHDGRKTTLWPWIIITLTAGGFTLVAMGITFSRTLELVGATCMSLGLLVHVTRTLFIVVPRLRMFAVRHAGARDATPPALPRLRGSVAPVLLTLSSFSILAGMALAVYYAVGRAFDAGTIALDAMLDVHAPLNAIGFALCGVLGWRFARHHNRMANDSGLL